MYDSIIIGAGVVNLLEAAHEAASGRTVLVLEKSCQIGGAWATTNISDWRGVEKGVHYLSPDPRAKAFLANFLGLGIDRMRPKYLVINDPADSCQVVDFRSLRSRLAYPNVYWRRAKYGGPTTGWKDQALHWLRLPMNVALDRSWYLAEGSSSLTSQVQSLCELLEVPIALEQEATELHFVESGVCIRVRDRSFLASRVLVPHGVSNLMYRFGTNPDRLVHSPNQQEPRPQLLLVISSTHVEHFSEYIFVKDPMVKYAHEISGYARPGNPLNSQRQRIFAVALHPLSVSAENIPELVFHHLQTLGVIDGGAELVESRLRIEYIPRVDYALAQQIEHASRGRLSFLLTENMAAALGRNASRWMDSLGPLLRL